MIDMNCCRESMNPLLIPRLVQFKINFRRSHPDYFDPDGLVIFVGGQGTGKTLSAVNYVYRLLAAYPECKLVVNIKLWDFPVVTFDKWKQCTQLPELPDLSDDERERFYFDSYVKSNRVFPFTNNDDFVRYYNGEFGVIFFVDEIQLYLNSLESKNINIDVVTQISQQRKQRKHIVATSQVFGRMAKPLREQFSCVIAAKNWFDMVQENRLMDRDSLDSDESTGTNLSGQVKKKFWFIHTPEMYSRYDTSFVVSPGKFTDGEQQLDIYENKGKEDKKSDD